MGGVREIFLTIEDKELQALGSCTEIGQSLCRDARLGMWA